MECVLEKKPLHQFPPKPIHLFLHFLVFKTPQAKQKQSKVIQLQFKNKLPKDGRVRFSLSTKTKMS